MDVSLLHLNFRNLYILYMQYIYTLQVHMTTSGIVIHYVGLDCKSSNPLKIHCFKEELYVQFAQRLQESNPGIKHVYI